MPVEDREHMLLKLIKEGDAASFDEVYNSYYQKVYSFSYRYLQNTREAEGVVQEVFLTLWNKREELEEIRNLNAWLFTVTFNRIRKIFRSMALEREKMAEYSARALFEDRSTLSSVEFNDLMENAETLIDRLPQRQKTILLMRMKEGLSSTEISRKLQINKRTVENHLSNARATLRKIFEEEKLITLILLWLLLT